MNRNVIVNQDKTALIFDKDFHTEKLIDKQLLTATRPN